MLKDFAKLETFLTVMKERSFSKASAKLGISQPAVTQQIKYIEDYLDARIVERKKNGIKLTKEGEDLHAIATKLSKAILSAEKDLLKIINKEFTFVMGSSFTIGNYLLPPYLNSIKDKIKNEVYVKVDTDQRIVEAIKDKKVDIGLLETPEFSDGLIQREWIEDELVIFSNQPIPKTIKPEDLFNFDWIWRDEESPTRKVVEEVLDEIDINCSDFSVRSIVGSTTAVKETILRAPKSERPTVSVISRHVIRDQVNNGQLFEGRIRQFKIKRKFYIAYHKERKHDAFIDNVVSYLMTFN